MLPRITIQAALVIINNVARVPVVRILYYCFSIAVSRGHIVSGLTGTFIGVPVPLIIMYFSLVSGAGTLATAYN